jgi:outer membrane protein TolC
LPYILKIALLCSCLAAMGCVHYQAVPIEPKAGSDTFAARKITDVTLPDDLANVMAEASGTWPPQQWNRAQLLAVALSRNPQLAVARAEVGAAAAHEISAAEWPNPDLTLQSEYARHDPHPWLYGISLNWLLRSPERRRLDRQIAALGTADKRLDLMDQAWSVRSSLASALSDWEGARRRLDVLKRLADVQDRLTGLEKRRVEAGEDAPIELLTSQQARIQIERQQALLRETVETAQAAAAKALGLPPESLDGVAFTWPEWGAPPPVEEGLRREAREQALLSRSDLGIAIDAYATAEAKLKLAVARQYPELELSPGYYWDHGIAKFPFDVGLSLPLNGNRGEIAEARAARELAARRMLALQANIYGDIAAAERAEGVARAGTEAAVRQVEAAEQQRQRAALGLKLGATGTEGTVAADIVALQAELELIESRARLQSSRDTLEDVLHAPLSGPELALAKSLPRLAEAGPR